jgi:hypothetical protein
LVVERFGKLHVMACRFAEAATLPKLCDQEIRSVEALGEFQFAGEAVAKGYHSTSICSQVLNHLRSYCSPATRVPSDRLDLGYEPLWVLSRSYRNHHDIASECEADLLSAPRALRVTHNMKRKKPIHCTECTGQFVVPALPWIDVPMREERLDAVCVEPFR